MVSLILKFRVQSLTRATGPEGTLAASEEGWEDSEEGWEDSEEPSLNGEYTYYYIRFFNLNLSFEISFKLTFYLRLRLVLLVVGCFLDHG
jgi:hypothetical protein